LAPYDGAIIPEPLDVDNLLAQTKLARVGTTAAAVLLLGAALAFLRRRRRRRLTIDPGLRR